MKKISISIFVLMLCITVLSQVPQAFKYQAVARDASGNVLANRMVSFRISIIPGSATGSAVFTETHTKTTNAFGLVDLEIGSGTKVIGSFSSIEWANNIYFFNVEFDPAGGTSFILMGTSQLLSVPYAQHALTVENDNVDDADNDPSNEIQTLELAGYDLTLSKGGGTVTLPLTDLGDNWGTQTVQTDATLEGNGTSTAPLKIASQSALTGQTLKWNGTTWLPGDDLTGTSIWTPSGANIYFNTGRVGIGKDPAADLRRFQVLTTDEIAVAATNNSTSYPTFRAENQGVGLAASFYNAGGTVAAFYNNLLIQDGTQGLGKVLTSDANGYTSWQTPLAGPWETGGSTGTEYAYTNKAIGVRAIPFNSAFLFNGTGFSNGGTVVFSGSYEPSTPSVLPTLTTTVRMLWYPNKAAFRAGLAAGTQWNRENIGNYSAAFGYDCTASGDYSFAANNVCSAVGDYSIALGSHASSTGTASSSIGYYTEASGNYSFAEGYMTNATGSSSAAFNNSTTASGSYSSAFGFQTTATNLYSFSQGYASDAEGVGSFATGLNTTAVGMYSFSTGSNSTAAGMYSFTAGYGTTAPSLCEFVVGINNTIYTGNTSSFIATNRIFVVGNGSSSSDRSNALTVLKNGNVGIGVDAPTYTLAVSGTAAKTGGGSWSNLSDRRLKDIQGEYPKGLNEIVALQPVMFTYKKDNPLQLNSNEQQIGFVAQEVQAIFPEAVNENSSGYLDFNMHPVNVALVNAVKELKAENDKLKTALNELLERMANMEAQLQTSSLK